MKAAVLVAPKEPLWVTDGIEVPPPGRGQVVVRIAYTGLCHSQLMEVSGLRGPDPWLPHLLGHEATGRVEMTGADVTKVNPGDAVILSWIRGVGLEAPGARYRRGDMIINSGAVTTFSEYTVVSENRCTPLPHKLPMSIGSLLGCAVMTGAGAVMNAMQPAVNSSIVIFGLGGIGMSALMAARRSRPAALVAVDVVDSKLSQAEQLGATHTVNAVSEDPVAAIRKICAGGADFALDASGQTAVIEQAFASVRPHGGLCVFASHPAAGEVIRLDPFDLICGKQIRGTWGGDCKPDRDIPLLADLYVKNELPLDRLISVEYTLDEINSAMADLRAGEVTRALIRVNPDV
jgi:S-(hydroxymethyl)glutathione dehydrogenase/alcohol dehydrogenase